MKVIEAQGIWHQVIVFRVEYPMRYHEEGKLWLHQTPQNIWKVLCTEQLEHAEPVDGKPTCLKCIARQGDVG